jgi:hypothetical protein
MTAYGCQQFLPVLTAWDAGLALRHRIVQQPTIGFNPWEWPTVELVLRAAGGQWNNAMPSHASESKELQSGPNVHFEHTLWRLKKAGKALCSEESPAISKPRQEWQEIPENDLGRQI